MKKLSDKFGKLWQEQFRDAESTPDAAVWNRIEANLAGGLVEHYRKKILYYKLLAAASVVLALLFGSYSLYQVIHQDGTDQQMAQQTLENRSLSADTDNTANQNNLSQQEILENMTISSSDIQTRRENRQNHTIDSPKDISVKAADESGTGDTPSKNTTGINDVNSKILITASGQNTYQINEVSDREDQDLVRSVDSYTNFTDSYFYLSRPHIRFNVPNNIPDRKYYLSKKQNPLDIPYLLPPEEEIITTDKKRLWAGVTVSSGIFDPNISYGGSNDLPPEAAFNSTGSVATIYSSNADMNDRSGSLKSYKPEESSYRPEASFSYGVDFGFRFSKRLVLLGGLGYQHNFGSTTVHTYVEPISDNVKYANHAIVIERVAPESGLNTYNQLNSEVRLNSTFEFVSVPVNIGYYLIDRKFKWMMTAGITTDVFIRNSISDSENMFDPVSFRSGDDSPYNPVYFNGKVGTMFHYTILKNYQISLEPSYRIGLNDLTKEEASFISRPSSFLISAGVAYVF